jgi:nucleotide-binding universal stress UspA family protein
LIRPAATPPELTALRPFHQFLIPLDGSPLAEQILEPTLALGALTGSAYTLVQIIDPLAQPGEVQIEYAAGLDYVITEDLHSTAEAYLSQVAARVQAHGYTVQTQVVIADHPAAALVDVAEASGADVIALTTHGRGALGRLLLGSVTDKVVRSAEIPILVYGPKDHEAQ